MNIAEHIRTIPDFPKPGILFYDISTLLAHPGAWRRTIDLPAGAIRPPQPDFLLGLESRGFLVAPPLALERGCVFAMIRKRGQHPGETVSHTHTLEYEPHT